MDKRGLTYREAMAYVGVKRRTFDEVWRPHLVAIPQGVCLIFDRQQLDELFDRFKNEAAGDAPAANDEASTTPAHNAPRNGRPIVIKGVTTWANQRGVSTPRGMEPGKSTSGSTASAFANAVSLVSKRRNAG